MPQSMTYNPLTGEWNDSLAGDFLWSNVNVSEAVPDIMTPSTWSLWQIYHYDASPIKIPGNYPFCGNLCGRAYLNLSLVVSLYRAVGKDIREELHGDLIGSAPTDLSAPIIPFSAVYVIWKVLPGMLKAKRYAHSYEGRVPEFVATNPDWCRAMRAQIAEVRDKPALLALWRESIRPRFVQACWMLRSVTMLFFDPATKLRSELTRMVGEVDANALLSGGPDDSKPLESLTPLIGLAQAARGELSREGFLERYGHRGPHEMELSAPSLEEDLEGLDRRLADFARSSVNVEALLRRQQAESANAWRRFEARYPRQRGAFRLRLDQVAEASRVREAVRSEVTRLAQLVRRFALRAGMLTGLESGIFFLSLDEIMAVLSGDQAPTSCIPARRDTYQRYSALPPYPPIIVGRFDPFRWAADPNRRMDYYDARQSTPAPASEIIIGAAGAAGCVEGIVRRIDRPEEGHLLKPGEILVTFTTNVGWTPLFPRAAAIVTDVGAPLSHAAIVARELGIPAVVGCGNATMRLKSGDRVLVDGGKGIVKVLQEVGR